MLPTASDPRLALLSPPAREAFLAALAASARLATSTTENNAERLNERGLYESALVAAGFAQHDPARGSWSRREIPLASALGPEQRAAAELYADLPGIYVDRVGIYSAAWVRRRWLGLDPPGALFRPLSISVDGVSAQWPAFHALRTVVRRDEQAALALLRALPVGERLELLGDLVLARVDYFETHLDTLLYELRSTLRDEGRAWAPAFADRLLALFATPHREVERGNANGIPMELSLLVMLALVRAGVPLKPRWDALLSLGGFTLAPEAKELLNAVPAQRRDAAVGAMLARHAVWHHYAQHAATLLPDFPLPSMADFVLAHLDVVRLRRDVLKGVESVARTEPEVRAALERFRKRQAAIPVLTLTERTAPRALDELDALGRAQLEECNARYGGTRLSAEALFDTTNIDQDGEQIDTLLLERWRVVDARGAATHDAWLYMGDSGCFFTAGTLELVAEVIQGGVQCDERVLKQGLTQALSDRARSAAPKRARATPGGPKRKR